MGLPSLISFSEAPSRMVSSSPGLRSWFHILRNVTVCTPAPIFCGSVNTHSSLVASQYLNAQYNVSVTPATVTLMLRVQSLKEL